MIRKIVTTAVTEDQLSLEEHHQMEVDLGKELIGKVWAKEIWLKGFSAGMKSTTNAIVKVLRQATDDIEKVAKEI